MRSFPDLGHWTLRRLSDCFELEKEDVGSDAHLKKRESRWTRSPIESAASGISAFFA